MVIIDEIQIDAPPDIVWQVTEDIERWPTWTPTMTSVKRIDRGPIGVGTTAFVKQPGEPEATWVVTEFASGRLFAWETRRPGLRMLATHEVSASGDGTKNILRFEVRGPVAVVLWPVVRRTIGQVLKTENRALKKHCETLAAGQPPTSADPDSLSS